MEEIKKYVAAVNVILDHAACIEITKNNSTEWRLLKNLLLSIGRAWATDLYFRLLEGKESEYNQEDTITQNIITMLEIVGKLVCVYGDSETQKLIENSKDVFNSYKTAFKKPEDLDSYAKLREISCILDAVEEEVFL